MEAGDELEVVWIKIDTIHTDRTTLCIKDQRNCSTLALTALKISRQIYWVVEAYSIFFSTAQPELELMILLL